jgi:hypothetical protein
MLNEFYRVAFRKRRYGSLAELQARPSRQGRPKGDGPLRTAAAGEVVAARTTNLRGCERGTRTGRREQAESQSSRLTVQRRPQDGL